MKIAYVNCLPDPNKVSGVVKKICHQKKAAETLKLGIDFFLFSEEDKISSKLCFENKINFIPMTSNPLLRQFLVTKQLVTRFNNNYDVVIFRDIGFTPFSWLNYRKRRFKLITEHHEKTLYSLLGSMQTKDILKAILYQLSAKSNLSNIDGIIAVTDEIRKEQIIQGFQKKDSSIAISNGIDVHSVHLSGFRSFDGKTLKLVFVGTNSYYWNGIDRMIEGINQYTGTVKLELNIVGSISRDDFSKYKIDGNKIKFHGTLLREKLDDLMQEMNLGISSLAVHRKRLKEASALKTREYTARGIPFLYAYDDMDLQNNLPFCKKMPANEEPIDMNSVIYFAEDISRTYQTDELIREMRSYAYSHMDWKAKMKTYFDFAERIAFTP